MPISLVFSLLSQYRSPYFDGMEDVGLEYVEEKALQLVI